MLTLYDVVIPENYKTKTGEEKTIWNNVGLLKKTEDGKMFLKLYANPSLTHLVFERKPKEQFQKSKVESAQESQAEEEVSLDNIPF